MGPYEFLFVPMRSYVSLCVLYGSNAFFFRRYVFLLVLMRPYGSF